jgi:hypothetical protein
MPQIRHVVAVAALFAGAACSPTSQSTPSTARDLTLAGTLAPSAVLGPSERISVSPAPRQAALVAAPAARPRVTRRAAVAAAPDAAPVVEAPVPAAAETPALPTPAPIVDTWTGAGHSLAPGQAVGVVPVAMEGGTRMPQTDLVSERGIRWSGMIAGGDDRCIPGRDEMLPGFRARRN